MGSITPNSSMRGSTYTHRTIKVRLRPQQCSEKRHRCCAHTISSINICASVNCRIKGILHADSTTEKASKEAAYTKFKYVAEGRFNRDENSPINRAEGACMATCVRSERGACTSKGVSAATDVAGTVEGCADAWSEATRLSGCGTVTSTAEAPTSVCPMLM